MNRSRLSIQQGFYTIAIFCMVVAVIVIGQPVLAPLALACILAFVLTPIVRFLEARGSSRAVAVGFTVAMIVIVAATLSTALVVQLSQLAAELPAHSQEIEVKATRLRQTVTIIPENVWATFEGVTGISTTGPRTDDAAEVAEAEPSLLDRFLGDRYLVIEREEASPWMQMLPLVVLPALPPLGIVAIAIVLAVFMTAKRDDLRNRLLALLGHARLAQTTQLLSDSSERLSRFLLGLVTVNLGFAIAFSIGLVLIGVPYAALWGCVAFFFRFIPWLGSAVSMLLPLSMSIATQPGWFPPLAVAGLYIFLEFTTGNFVEPWLFGKSVGMNVLAIFVAIIFWTWAWGIIGMLLATPLSLTLVTLGRHFPCFGWLNLMLGDSHALPSHVAFYQRLLVKDEVELTSMLALAHRQSGATFAMHTLVLQSLCHADRELRRGVITQSQHRELVEEAGRLTERLILHAEQQALIGAGITAQSPGDDVEDLKGSNGRLDDPAATKMAAFSLGDDRGLQAIRVLLADKPQMNVSIEHRGLTLSIAKKWIREQPEIIILSVANQHGRSTLESACRMLRRCGYEGWIAAGWWRDRGIAGRCRRQLKTAGADYVTHRLFALDRMLKFAEQNHAKHRNPISAPPLSPSSPAALSNV